MYKFGLIGFPIAHSYSPTIQQIAFDYANVKGEYLLFPLSPEGNWKAELAKILEKMHQGGIHGLNVTVPYKKLVMEFLDRTSNVAEDVGAVNTICVNNTRLIGENTDVQGFWMDLTKHFNKSAGEKKDALILGAGGAARAVVYALISHNWRVWIYSRRCEQAQELEHDFTQKLEMKNLFSLFSKKKKATAIESLKVIKEREIVEFLQYEGIDLVVNTTPLGTATLVDTTPWQEGWIFPKNALIYDLVYNPSKTRLMRQAEAQGLRVCNGLGMLVEQAILSFHLWTGIRVPSELIWQRLSDEGSK
jgi:shikimate dehydrogenase